MNDIINLDELSDIRHSRYLSNLNNEDQSCEPLNFINPTENCKNLISLFFEEHKMSFDQFCQFDTIPDLDFLKNSLNNYPEFLEIEDENNFTKFFVESLPLEDDQINDSIFSIFAKIVSKYYRNLEEICQIIQKCVPNFSNHYFIDIFTAICVNHPLNHQWEIIIEKFNKSEIQVKDFLKASSGLIQNHIYPPKQEDFISLLASNPTIGIFKVLKILNLTRVEIQTFDIDLLLIDALKCPDSKLIKEALEFISEESHVFLLQNNYITEGIFSLLEIGNYEQKADVIYFFDKVIEMMPIDLLIFLINEDIIEKVGDMLYGSTLEIQFFSLRIIRFCIDVQKNNILGKDLDVIERCHQPNVYDIIAELKDSPDADISFGATDVINELDNVPLF